MNAGIFSLVMACTGVLAGCGGEEQVAVAVAGDPRAGSRAIHAYGCGTCHIIPGIRGANGRVGPPLEAIAERAYLGGVIPNSPEAMMRWIMDPRAVDPRTAMPDTGVSRADARNITAYLYTLR